MRILPDPVSFVWDKGNIDKSVKKHGITNKESEEVFENKPLLLYEDLKHSGAEKRFQALGKTNKKKLLFLSFTIRGDKVRIISARTMNRKERGKYEKI